MTGLLDEIIGNSVYDRGGDKIGKVKQIYIDNTSGAPTWAAVSTGFFHDDSLVPLAGARHEPGSDALQVQVAKDEVKSAPHVDLEPEISVDDERELFTHYHLDPRGAGWDAGGGPGYDRRADDEMIRSEERLEIDRERTTTGRARLRKYVVTEEQTVTVPTTHEEVRIEREPITDPRAAEHADIGDEEREVTLHEDRLTVDKEAVPVERARLAVDEVEDSRTVSGTVRKERFETEGVEDDPNRER